jgi:hypothetical protein
MWMFLSNSDIIIYWFGKPIQIALYWTSTHFSWEMFILFSMLT